MGDCDIEKLKEEYKSFCNDTVKRWEFANEILYKMCENNIKHEEDDVIAGKLLLIGRSYAAAIERRKIENNVDNDDFYYLKVVPKMKEIGNVLDEKIKLLNSKDEIKDNIDLILATHCSLVSVFHDLTDLNKRSLASKYLYFHCKNMFFIYDSIASSEVKKITDKPSKEEIKKYSKYDKEYVNFVLRMIKLQEELAKTELDVSPRMLDSFLLMRKNKK